MKFGWRFREMLMKSGPWLTLLATLGLAGWIHFGGPGPAGGKVVGFAQGVDSTVASLEVGRIAVLAVEPGQAVTAGQVIASLDPGPIDAEIAVVEAEKTRLEALIPSEQAESMQKLDESVESLERDLAEAQEAYAQAKSQAQALETERSRAKKLVEDKLAVGEELAKLDVEYAAVKPVVDEKPRHIQLLKKQLEAARSRRERTVKTLDEKGVGPLAGDLLVATAQLEQLKKRRADLVLRAPVSGRVTMIWKRPGDVVAAAEPLVTLVSAQNRVVACVPERQALRVSHGDRAKLWVQGGPSSAPLTGTTVALAPIVTEVSLRCRRVPNLPAWGREVTIELDPSAELVPGQAFDIDFDHSTAPPKPPEPAPLASPAPAAGDKPSVIKVPDKLKATSRVEPSGILFRPDLSRYVVVSDDTGFEQKDEHAPWMFTMDERGTLDPEPLIVSGVKELNDLESITAGDGGAVYVLASQGYSKKGKRRPSRTALLRLAPEGRGFRAEAEMHLVSLIEAAGQAEMAKLGLPNGTRELEIEGMTYFQGALYFGLKAPLDAQGNALIWKVADPKALFSAPNLGATGLSLWAQARLEAEVDGRAVAGGISEILFLPDGSLLITSTSSKEEGTTESGKLWRVPSPAAGALSPELVKSFPGLKPEGLCLSASAGKLVVAFDTGASMPMWMEMPWPR
jgi:multidrug resistance efflux pump